MANHAPRPSRHEIRRVVAALTLGLAICHPAQAGENAIEAKVKAAYLVHLAKFVEWPNLPANEMRICVIGSETVGDLMSQVASRQLRERTLKIDVDNPDPTQCQVLFIGQNERRQTELLKRLRGQSVLTVGDAGDFARQGGIVGFYAEAGRIKLEINPDNARGANLRLSAKLLELARTVP